MDGIKKNFGFGCMRLPMKDGEVDKEQMCKMVDTFLEQGFNYFDTAHGYLDGKSELALRDCLTSRHDRSKYILTNKLTNIYFKSEEEIRQKVEETLKICGLYPFRNWPVSALSFGQKKRETIASVLVQDPELIILDEPTAGQAFKHYTEIMEFLRKLNDRGVTVVMITHDMHLMLEYTPRALVFSDGQMIADRRASEVLCDPELIERAALKETSLFTLANQCEIAPPEAFVERFIEEDREVRSHGC